MDENLIGWRTFGFCWCLCWMRYVLFSFTGNRVFLFDSIDIRRKCGNAAHTHSSVFKCTNAIKADCTETTISSTMARTLGAYYLQRRICCSIIGPAEILFIGSMYWTCDCLSKIWWNRNKSTNVCTCSYICAISHIFWDEEKTTKCPFTI